MKALKFLPKKTDAWLSYTDGLAWRECFVRTNKITAKVVYTHLWPASQCTECFTDFLSQPGF